jgi:hypothetical protein
MSNIEPSPSDRYLHSSVPVFVAFTCDDARWLRQAATMLENQRQPIIALKIWELANRIFDAAHKRFQ